MLLDLVTLMQVRFRGIFTLMSAMGMVGPPVPTSTWRRGDAAMERLASRAHRPDHDQLAVSPSELAQAVRLLTFSGTHPHLSRRPAADPEEIVAVLLHGVRRKKDS